MTKKEHYKEVLKRLRKRYAKTKADFVLWDTPLELVVGTILSAQCTDKRVNAVTRTLFKKYRTAKDYAEADLPTLKKEVYSTGFYNSKAKYLKGMGTLLVEEFDGEVPSQFEDLLRIPGVSRKTAHLIMAKHWNQFTGVAVDTHVKRLAPRLGWTKETKNPLRIERDLNKMADAKDYLDINEYAILLGRDLCVRTPKCEACPLADICPTGKKRLAKKAS